MNKEIEDLRLKLESQKNLGEIVCMYGIRSNHFGSKCFWEVFSSDFPDKFTHAVAGFDSVEEARSDLIDFMSHLLIA